MANRIFPYIKTAAPTVTDDTTAGYKVGDMWLDTTNDKVYQVIDVSTSAAIWIELVGRTQTQTLTDKSISLGNNTVTGNTAQFNTALTDGNFATQAGAETLTNKALTAPTIADFTNAAHDHGDADDGGAVVTASDTVAGVIELATDAETITGTATDKALTPANLQAMTGTATRDGILELATDAEAITGTDTARAVTPANLTAVLAATPTITNFTNANHDHGDADDGGALNTPTITGGITVTNGNVRSFSATIADDAAASFTPSSSSGTIQITCGGTGNGGLGSYNTVTPTMGLAVGGANLAVATGILSGTTGTDTKLTISAHTDGKIYIENRTGASRTVFVFLS